jgi:hypothetical protein
VSNKSSVAALREQLETMFPGKLFTQTDWHRCVLTGLPSIDRGITHGLMRRRIAEWVGSESSGKTTVLRSIVSNWCAAGFHVVYIDALSRLIAADWAFVDKFPINKQGKFWVVRNLREADILWATEQLVRSGIFDVVILEIDKPGGLNSRAYARLQRALDRSKTALVLVKDEPDIPGGGNTSWGCDSRFRFGWSQEVQYASGLNDTIVSIQPSIHGTVWRDGLSQSLEIKENAHVANRLFTHPQVPDRRIPKARTRAEKETAGANR